MLDTIKLGIPLSQKQFNHIQKIAYSTDRDQWALFNPTTGDLWLRKVVGLVTTDQNSFHREIRWDISPTFIKGATFLTVELSLPKLWYGHNIHLLYEFVKAIVHLKGLLEDQFKLKRNKFADVMNWQVWRADVCYAWRMPSQQAAQQFLDSLKHLHYPRKRPTVHPTSISFVGTTYSVKFYLKLPEFETNDMKALKKGKASEDWIKHLRAKADGVLRYEATLRRKYLERQGIKTVADLTRISMTASTFSFDEECGTENLVDSFRLIVLYNAAQGSLKLNSDGMVSVENGQYLAAPPLQVKIDNRLLAHKGGGFRVNQRDNLTAVLQYFLTKFMGENTGMQHVDEVRMQLKAAYKPVKAARLVSMWLYVQRFGTEEAKREFGRDSYYKAKRDMKVAGVSLIEPPENVTTIDGTFLRAFKMQVPSSDVTNREDDFRDSENLLNLIPTAVSSSK